MTASVLLVDDHELIRQGLRRAFERQKDFEVVADVGTIDEAQALLSNAPNVAIIDLRIGDGNGLDLVRAARAARPDMGIVVLTMYAGDEQLFAALEAGASAFVSKDAPTEEVIAAARHAFAAPHSFSAADLAEALATSHRAVRPAIVTARGRGPDPACRRAQRCGHLKAALHQRINNEVARIQRLRKTRREQQGLGGHGGDSGRPGAGGCLALGPSPVRTRPFGP